MLKMFDFLGPLKWPSLLAITALPAVSFAFWGGFDDPVPMRRYGPFQAGDLKAVLEVPRSSDIWGGESRWCLLADAVSEVALSRAEASYGGDRPPSAGWQALEQEDNRMCATLARPSPGQRRIWIRLAGRGIEFERSWGLAES